MDVKNQTLDKLIAFPNFYIMNNRQIFWEAKNNTQSYSMDPYIKLNTDGSAIGNPGLAGAGGILGDSSGWWLLGFSLNLGIVTNNMAELAAVR